MLLELLLVESVEVLREGLGNYRLHMGLACLWATLQLERLVYSLVGSFKLKLLGLVVRDSKL